MRISTTTSATGLHLRSLQPGGTSLSRSHIWPTASTRELVWGTVPVWFLAQVAQEAYEMRSRLVAGQEEMVKSCSRKGFEMGEEKKTQEAKGSDMIATVNYHRNGII